MEEENSKANGMELLKKVISTNEENIEKVQIWTERQNRFEVYLKNLKGWKTDFYNIFEDFHKSFKEEAKHREDFLTALPKEIPLCLSDESLQVLEKFYKKSQIVKYIFWGSIGMLLLSLLISLVIGYNAVNWYEKSIRSKEEIRAEVLSEIDKDGKGIYLREDYESMKYNIRLINKWIETNPNDSEKFLRFKDGYDAKE